MSKKAYAIAVAALPPERAPIAFAAQPANHHAAGQSQARNHPAGSAAREQNDRDAGCTIFRTGTSGKCAT